MKKNDSAPAGLAGPSCIKAWRNAGVLFELHSGEPTALPPHSHSAYQIGITTRDPGRYFCRGKNWDAPAGSIILFHPHDVHGLTQIGIRQTADAASQLMYVEPRRMLEIARAAFGAETGMPVFEDLVIRDPAFIRSFRELHLFCGSDAPEHEKEARLRGVLEWLVSDFARSATTPPERTSERQLRRTLRARDFIMSNYRENISLAQLAELSHSSPYHFNRLFARHIGLPPHAFQNQVRVERSKALILEGASIAQVAMQTGFFDQSHFTRYFQRIVGVTPSTYALARR